MCFGGEKLGEEVLYMFIDNGAIGACKRGGERGADDFAAEGAVLSLCASGKDIVATAGRVAGEVVEGTFFEAVVEAVDGFEGFGGRE